MTITATPKPTTEAPFTFAAPVLPALESPDSALSANPDLAAVVNLVRTRLPELQTLAEQVSANPHLSSTGQRARFTDAALPVLRFAATHRATLDAAAKALEADAAALTADAANPPTAAPIVRQERLALAEAFSRLSREDKTRAIEAVMTGKDPALADALAWSHRLVTSIGEPIQRTLREQFAATRVDQEARARLEARAHLLREARALLDRATSAIESATDRAVVKAAGAATLRRSDMTDAAKAEYIGSHGLAAFKALPA